MINLGPKAKALVGAAMPAVAVWMAGRADGVDFGDVLATTLTFLLGFAAIVATPWNALSTYAKAATTFLIGFIAPLGAAFVDHGSGWGGLTGNDWFNAVAFGLVAAGVISQVPNAERSDVLVAAPAGDGSWEVPGTSSRVVEPVNPGAGSASSGGLSPHRDEPGGW